MEKGKRYNIDEPILGFKEVEVVGSRDTVFGKKIFYKNLGYSTMKVIDSMYAWNFKRRIIK